MTTNSTADWRDEDREWTPPAHPETLDVPEVAPADGEDVTPGGSTTRGDDGTGDRILDSVNEAVGKAKEALGKVTGSEDLQSAGLADQMAAQENGQDRDTDTLRG